MQTTLNQDALDNELALIEASRERDKIHYLPGNTPEPPEVREDLYAHQRLWSVLRDADMRTIELVTAFIALAWGIWVGNPFFSVYEGAHAFYAGAEAIAPEWAWGSLVGFVGILQFIGLATGKKAIRRHGAMLGVLAWLFVFGAAVSSPAAATTAPVGYPIMCLLCAWVYLRTPNGKK